MRTLLKQNKFWYELGSWQSHLRKILTNILAPLECSICGKETSDAISICSDCTKKNLEKAFENRLQNENCYCKVCGKELISELEICQRCKRTFIIQDLKVDDNGEKNEFLQKLFFHQNFALFPYIGYGQKILASWKIKSQRNFARLFGDFVFRFLEQTEMISNLPIVPVPPRPKKLKTKGWDQIADLGSNLSLRGKKVINCLKRYDGLSQKATDKKARSQNLVGKFYLNKAFIKKMPEKVVLLDDIITTGSTINECSKVLLQAGCNKVFSLCLFFD